MAPSLLGSISGAVAKRLCTGLQIRVGRFDSGPRLQISPAAPSGAVFFTASEAHTRHGLRSHPVARPDISPEEIATFSHRNVVTKCLGSKDDVEPTVSTDTLEPGDLYLLCSDGLWGMVKDARISEIACSTPDLEAACQLLLDEANHAGGPDNISAVLVRVG